MCCDVSEIYEVLFDEKHALLSRFMGFLLQPAPLHSALAGYFHRVVLSIMGKKPNQVLFVFFYLVSPFPSFAWTPILSCCGGEDVCVCKYECLYVCLFVSDGMCVCVYVCERWYMYACV